MERASVIGFTETVAHLRKNPQVRICGIAGFPCSHSKSPALYNRLFAHYKLNWHYSFFQWHAVRDLVGLVRDLDLRGLSVTIPFKQDVIPFLDEVDADAAAIGAVNTVIQCGGRLHGYNTDWLGVKIPLEHKRGARAALLGAGGASAAAAYALQSLEMEVTVLARTPEKARALAERMGCRSLPLSAFDKDDYDVVVNATPVGMEPDTSTLLSRDQLKKGMTVFDLVYTPPETPLIREARRAGCETICGTEMFVRQACEQFFLFTGIVVSPAQVREMIA